MVTRITWTGGEPTLCDSLSKLLGICHSNNITSVVTTHGLTLGSKLYASLDSGFDKLRFSFDGLEKTHNFIRGGYYFNKTINTMIEAKSKGFTIEVNVSVMQNNVTDIPELIVQLEKLGTNKIVLLSLMKRGGASNNNFVRPGEEAYLELNNQLNKLRIIYPWSSPRFNRTLIQPK
jgi:MoaA/NifB/PqqE/SkfB family radical SAM enzyme